MPAPPLLAPRLALPPPVSLMPRLAMMLAAVSSAFAPLADRRCDIMLSVQSPIWSLRLLSWSLIWLRFDHRNSAGGGGAGRSRGGGDRTVARDVHHAVVAVLIAAGRIVVAAAAAASVARLRLCCLLRDCCSLMFRCSIRFFGIMLRSRCRLARRFAARWGGRARHSGRSGQAVASAPASSRRSTPDIRPALRH